MLSLDRADAVCDSYLPGLLGELGRVPLADLERPGSPALEIFRQSGGPALLIPKSYGGHGVGPLEAIQVMRSIGSRSPSLAVATAMHHFSVATVFTLADSIRSSGLEWALLEGIADQNLLVASAFSEGEPGRGVLSPKVTGKSTEGGILVSGSKRPCSIARSMDLLSASAVITDEDGAHRTVVLLLPANSPGISVHPFWRSNVLAGAESDEVRLNDVFVDEKLILPVTSEADGSLDELQTTGFIWFEMMIASCYLGMATALVSQAIKRPGIGKQRIAEMGIRLETAAMLLDSIAHLILDGETGNAALARATIARYGAEDAIVDVANYAVRALGGMSFISSSDVAYLAAACQCLQFHPPSRIAGDSAVCAGLVGESFVIR